MCGWELGAWSWPLGTGRGGGGRQGAEALAGIELPATGYCLLAVLDFRGLLRRSFADVNGLIEIVEAGMRGQDGGGGSMFTRRRFLQTAGATAALATRTGWARGAFVPASDRITIGVIGWGMMGPANTKAFLTMNDCQVVAACDLDKAHLQAALDTINGHYGNQDCKGYHDYREMIARPDIDAIMIAVPDQWHAIIATTAAKAKKDIYGEKPLAKTVFEQQAIVREVEKHNVIWQTGSWQRSLPSFHKAAEIVRNGLIGDVTHVEVGLPG